VLWACVYTDSLVSFVLVFLSVAVGGNDEAAAPLRHQGNFGIAQLDPADVALFCCCFWGCSLTVVCVWLDQRKLAQRSERVKAVDLHPTEPW
jgi:hypothetical protein